MWFYVTSSPAQKLIDHWPVLTMLRAGSGNQTECFLDCADERMEGDLTHWTTTKPSKTAIVSNMEMQMGALGERHGKMISSTAQAIPHGRCGENGQVHKSREHFEAENMLPRIWVESLNRARSEVHKHRRRHSAKMAEQKLGQMKGKTKKLHKCCTVKELEDLMEESTMMLCRLESASRAAKLDGRQPPQFHMAHLLQPRASMN